MPVARFSVGLDSSNDYNTNCVMWSNAVRTAREWWESRITGGLWRDSLTYADAATGLPTRLDNEVQAESVFNFRSKPQQWRARWEGRATVAVRPLTDSASQIYEGSSFYTVVPPVGPAGTGDEFDFPNDGQTEACQILITQVDPLDPIRNLWVGPVEEAADTTGLSVRFRAAMLALRPPVVRLLDLMEPNQVLGTTVVNWADRRLDTWWTEANVALDVYAITVGAWSGAAPGLGEVVDYLGPTGSATFGAGTVVRVGSPVGGAYGHVKHSTGGIPASGDRLRVRSTGSTATLSAGFTWWQPLTRGPSIKAMRDLAAWLYANAGTHTIWPTWSVTATENWHRSAAQAFRDDARLVGLKVANELSNERWNTNYGYSREYAYVNAQGVALGMPGPNPWEKGAQWGAWQQHNIHEWWKAEYGGRAADIVRVFSGHNMSGEYWFSWRTIINPDNDAAFLPAWPRQVLPMDVWAVAPYPGQLDQDIYNRAGAWTGTPQINEQVWNGQSGANERRGVYVGRFNNSVVIELTVAPYLSFVAGNTVTGVTSGASFVVASGGRASGVWCETATDDDLFAYTEQVEVPRHITAPITGSLGLRSPGLTSHAVYATGRGAALWCYEWQTHYTGDTTAARATLDRFLASPQYAQIFDQIAREVAARVSEACFYAFARPRGPSGYWDLVEGFTGDTARGVRWDIVLRMTPTVVEFEFEEGDLRIWATPCTLEVVPPQSQLVELPTDGAIEVAAATETNFDVIPTTEVVLSSEGAIDVAVAGEPRLEIVSDTVDVFSEGAVEPSVAGDVTMTVLPPESSFVDLWTAYVCESSYADGSDFGNDTVELVTADATEIGTSQATALVAAPIDGSGRTVVMWQAGGEGYARKPRSATIRRVMLLGHEEDSSGPFVAPLRGGKRFAGIAMEHVGIGPATVKVSRLGSITVDFEGSASNGEALDFAAYDDQRIVPQTVAQASKLRWTHIGRGLVTEPGVALIDYRAEGYG